MSKRRRKLDKDVFQNVCECRIISGMEKLQKKPFSLAIILPVVGDTNVAPKHIFYSTYTNA